MFNKDTENRKALVVAVKDEMTGTFFQPMFFKGDKALEQATRLFESQVNNNQLWRDNPNDFSLWNLGQFDEELGCFERKLLSPEKIASGSSALRKEK